MESSLEASEHTGRWSWVYWVALGAAILGGVYLRLDGLGEPSLWHDEILHVSVAERTLNESPLNWLLGLESDSENGPLYYATQLLANRVVGGDTGVRLVPALVGIATLPLMAFAGSLVSGRLLSLVATLFLAVSPLHVYFSREGRPYSMVMFLACLMLVLLLRPLGRWSVALGYATCLAAAYTGAMSAPVLGAFGAVAAVQLFWWLWKGRVGNLTVQEVDLRRVSLHFVMAATIGIALIAQLYIDLEAAPQYAPDFSTPRTNVFTNALSERAVKKFVASMSTSGVERVSTQPRSLWFMVLAAVGAGAGLWQRRRATLLIAGMFLLPTLASFAAMIAMGRFYGVRYTCSGLTAFVLLVGLGVVALARLVASLIPPRIGRARFQSAVAVLVALAVSIGVAGPNVVAARSQTYEKLDWRGLAKFFHDASLDGETIVAASRWPRMCLRYYFDQLPDSVPIIDVPQSVEAAESIVEKSESAWLVTAGVRRTGDLRKWMHQFDHILSRQVNELDVFFSPDFKTLLETRFESGRGGVFNAAFDGLGHRFDFEVDDLLLQGAGWSFSEQNREGISFQWATASEAELGIPVESMRTRMIRFRALPFVYPDAPTQTVEVVLNSNSLATFDLEKGWSEHEVRAPASAWVSGPNFLILRFGRTTSPAQVIPGSADRRYLSAAFDYLEVAPVD